MITGTATRDVVSAAIVRPARCCPAGAGTLVTGVLVTGVLVSCFVAGLVAGVLVPCAACGGVAGAFVPCADADAATARRTMPRRRTLLSPRGRCRQARGRPDLEHVRLYLEAGLEEPLARLCTGS